MTLAERITDEDAKLCASMGFVPCLPDHVATALGRTWVVPGHKLERVMETANISNTTFYIGVDKHGKVWDSSRCQHLRDLECGYILTVPPERGAR